MVGHAAFSKGDSKNTYGTGCFMLLNTGEEVVMSKAGLLTTVCYQLGPTAKPVYALEGSVAIAGVGISWLKDNLNMISDVKETAELAASVDDTGGVYLVPAFSGLFAPFWREDARGVIVGLSQFTTRAHIVRAMLEAVAYQTMDVVDAMEKDSGVKCSTMKVHRGMAANRLPSPDVC
jgi:glycerol kinase